MPENLKESCGVYGIFANDKQDVAKLIYTGLMTLQHRGQESSGISVLNEGRIKIKKSMGLVSNISEEMLTDLKGSLGIGHVRYSTAGRSVIEDAQPFMINYPRCGIVLGFNGNVVNSLALRKALVEGGNHIDSTADGEIITRILGHELIKTNDLQTAMENFMNQIEGSYCTTVFTGHGELIAFRDPFGFRPLVFGQNDNLKVFASETAAINIHDINNVTDLNPGEMEIVNSEGAFERCKVCPCNRIAHCMFEYVYFSRPDSVIDGKSVYEVRLKLGENLGKTYTSDADVIIPVPDTARTAAEGLSKQAGIPVTEGLIKNRYIWRTFIMPDWRTRYAAVRMKLNPIKSAIKDKKVILVDDSIVRGTTTGKIVDLVKKAGAKKVEVFISCPPIISPCFYGIDISTHSELIAANNTVEEIAKATGADKINYQTIEGLIDAIGFSKNELCNACLTGEYPTPLAQQLSDKMKDQSSINRARYFEREEAAS